MTITNKWVANGAEFIEKTAGAANVAEVTAATKTATEQAARIATKATAEAAKTVVKNTTAQVEAVVKVARAAAANNTAAAKVAADAITDATGTTVAAFQQVADGTTPTVDVSAFGVEATTAKVQEFTETFVAQAKQAGLAAMDSYDKGFAALVDMHTALANSIKPEYVAQLAVSNIQAVVELNNAYTGAVRDLVK